MVDTVKTIGAGGDYADPILWAAAEGNVNDGTRAVGELISDVTMSALFRPNQTFPNGGLLRGDTTVTGKTGDGRTLGNTAGTRICLAPSSNLDFEDLEWDIGTNTYTIQNSENNTITRCLMVGGFIYYTADKTLTLNNVVINRIDGLVSTVQGNIVFNNTTVTDRLIIRAETLLTIKNSNSLGTDWLLGRGTYTNSDTLVNYCYILQNAPASDFGTGSSNNTINADTTLEMVDYAGGDYRIKSASTLATAGEGGTFIGAFLEPVAGGGVTGSSDITIPEPLFSISGTATLPQPVGNISFNIDAPLFSSAGEATLPQPSGNISFSISEPVFSVAGSATLPQSSASISFAVSPPLFSASGTATTPNPSGTVDFSVAKPVFSSTGSASLPQPSGEVSFEISKPLFSGSGSASLPNPQGVVSFNIDKPIFSAIGSATLPNPSGSISFSISAPLFSATGTVSGLNLPLGTVLTLTSGSSNITVNTGVNAITLPNESNTIKL